MMNKLKNFLLVYFLFCFSFFTFFASGFIDSQDGFQYLAIARRIYYDQTFEMPEEKFPDDNIHMSLTLPVDGKYYSPTGLGYSLSLLPAVFLEDVFLRFSKSEPISAFPLKSDWPVLLFASMTNSFWTALLAIFLYLYIIEVGLNHKQALYLSLVMVVGTNLFVYSKHSFAQMMFVSTMTGTFLFLKKFVNTNNNFYLILTGVFYGLVVLSYNPTYILVLPSLGFYYLFLKKFKFSLQNITKLIQDALYGLIGLVPFLVVYVWFNNYRFGDLQHTGYGSGIPIPSFPPTYVILEGIWGLLLSPGKSIFVYSPILLIFVLFWFKLQKKFLPEIVAAFVLFFVYLWNIGTLLGAVDFLVWHGDSSWGPRYMLPTLPLLLVLIATIYKNMTKKQKLFVFTPLILIGFYINFLSILLPYQIRFAGLQTDAYINGRNFNVYEYGNEIPRYMPAFKLSKTLMKRIKNIKNTYDHGKYNLKLIDGFDHPFDLGWSVWRGMRQYSFFELSDSKKEVKKLAVQVRNHQLDPESSQSAIVSFKLNDFDLETKENVIPVNTEKEFIFEFNDQDLMTQNNIVEIISGFETSSSAQLKRKQVLFLQIIRINDLPQNIQTLDYPYVSSVSANLYGAEYKYWGNDQKDPWEIWHMHSGVYEQTFDLWWLRPLHYWDLPKNFFFGLIMIDITAIVYFGWKTIVKSP